MGYVLLFLAGALLCNAIPHLTAGLQGSPFPTPFAKPPGVGNSSPLVNFLWGAANVAAGLALAVRRPFDLGINLDTLVVGAGVLTLGCVMSVRFGKVRAQRPPEG